MAALSPSLRWHFFILLKFHFYWGGCKYVPWHTCRSQRTICRSLFSPSIRAIGNQIRVVRLDSKHLGPEAISTVLFGVFLIPDVLTGMRCNLTAVLLLLVVASDERGRVSCFTLQWGEHSSWEPVTYLINN